MRLYNTLSGSNEDVVPLSNNTISLYTCGLTVYSQPHVGNWVAYIYWDVLVRTLRANGFKVNRVQNITDVGHLTSDEDSGEDKMQKGAKREGLNARQVAEKYSQIADHEAYSQLGLIRPDHMPRATDYIEQQIDFVEELERRGYTYKTVDGIYFDTSKLDNYGELARLDIEGLKSGARIDDTWKKNPTDFALWKLSDPNEKRDMEWPSPWGKGFPGWHLECSVMAREILGDQIDIHTGGIDHIPVHHVNEIAQTESVTEKQFAKIWIHANHIKVDGKKMSKSVGNIYTLSDISERGYDIMAFKLMVLGKHYSTEGNFTWNILESSTNRLSHWKNIAALRWQASEDSDSLKDFFDASRDDILASLSDNLSTPEAIAIIERVFDKIENTPRQELNKRLIEELLEKIDELLGLDIIGSTPNISDEQRNILNEREAARKSQNWNVSDELRDKLASQGVSVKDSADGQLWGYV
ncbi:cysteine--tRNA ligase [Candidatus Nomurabacteria bacterium]|nr:cysteine--tRNA ligase [Candidatus Nomurabacteria bacterium]